MNLLFLQELFQESIDDEKWSNGKDQEIKLSFDKEKKQNKYNYRDSKNYYHITFLNINTSLLWYIESTPQTYTFRLTSCEQVSSQQKHLDKN